MYSGIQPLITLIVMLFLKENIYLINNKLLNS